MTTQTGIRELYQNLNRNPLQVVTEAYDKGLTLSRWLEQQNPSDKNSRLDAYERMLREANIITRSEPTGGFWASRANTFFEKGPANRVLYTEFFARKWREVVYGEERAIYLSSDGTPGSWQRPYSEAQQPRWDQKLAPAIPLSELVAITTPVDGQDYRSFYLEYSAEDVRKFRVGESADIPIAKLDDHENTIQLQKFGRGLQASYEQLRRMRVDKLAMQIAYMAVQSEVDKVAAALNILENGDGNSDTAPTTHDLTTLDTDATAGTLTIKGWLAYKLKFANPYMLTTAIMKEATALQLILLDAGSANTPLMGLNLGGMTQALNPINMTSDGVRYGWDSNASSLIIVGFDRRFALEQLVEIGGTISEMERFITNQTQIMTMTEFHGFAIMDANATLLLDVNA